MDDLNKSTYQVWEKRLKLEQLKKRLRVIIAKLESEEYIEKHGQAAYEKTLKEVEDLKKEQFDLETNQEKMERVIQLPNPFLQND